MPDTLIKEADSGDRQAYELAFSNIAHSSIQDRAPKLADYEVGFQLLDKSDEGDKAVGVFGFKAGPNWFYAPVFYLSGKIKGQELLYIKHENIFVPLRENWVNYLLSKRPPILGKSIDRNSRLFGVSNPDFTQLSRSPTKYASEKPGFDRELHKGFAKAACDATAIADGFKPLNFSEFLKTASLPVVQKFVQICQEFPKVAEAYDKWHGIESLSEAVKLAQERAKPSPLTGILAPTPPSIDQLLGVKQADETPKNGSPSGLRILSPENAFQSIIPSALDQEHLEKMLKEKLVMQDDRVESEMSRLYLAESTGTLTNPTTTGVYDVLLKEGEFTKCLVLVGPIGATSHAPFITVIELGDSPTYINAKASDVWVGNSDGKFAYADWWKELPESKTPGDRDRYIAIGPNGDATLPFRREYSWSTDGLVPSTKTKDGSEILEVCFDDNWADRYDTRLPRSYSRNDIQTGSSGDYYDKYRDGQRLHVNGARGSKLRAFRGDVYVPEGFKIVRVEARVDNDQDGDCLLGSKRPGPLKLGDLASAYFHIIGKQASFTLGSKADADKALLQQTEPLTLVSAGRSIFVNQTQFTDKVAAIVHLVRDHKLREKQARELIAESAGRQQARIEYRIKYAEAVSQDAPSAPAIPPDYISHGSLVNPDEATQYSQEYAMPVAGLRPNYADRSVYNPNTHFDPNAGGVGGSYTSTAGSGDQSSNDPNGGDLAAAVNSGQKEVFDTSMIGTMLKAVRDDSLVDRYLGPMVGGVDALGRLLFMFYWHGDEFAERYGKQDMPELEDSLRNAFEQAGDVVLFLRQKAVNPQGDGSTAIDLSAASNATNGL
jgi:hypothetical protein